MNEHTGHNPSTFRASADWSNARSIPIEELDGMRVHVRPMRSDERLSIRMTEETWRAMKAAAMSGTIMRFTLAALSGALLGAFAAYKWETRR